MNIDILISHCGISHDISKTFLSLQSLLKREDSFIGNKNYQKVFDQWILHELLKYVKHQDQSLLLGHSIADKKKILKRLI